MADSLSARTECSELEASLPEFAAAGPAELRENGARVAPLSTLSWEVRGCSDKPLLHLWSENYNLKRRVTRIDATLDSRFAYSQILASSAGEQGILDVLFITHTGRMAILELKAVEQPVFLLPTAKYWPRVWRHLDQGDFARYGYLPGVALQAQPPIVQLIAPSLRFHPATGILLKYLHPKSK